MNRALAKGWESCGTSGLTSAEFVRGGSARNFSSHEIASVYAAFTRLEENSARKLNGRGCVSGSDSAIKEKSARGVVVASGCGMF